ncbi:hypothetical protein Vadar_029892 [Vaccinium darrowii]|uniref:Uncharacterized protein n=1 Tax=Vaccinium darrowii TaxID=229202 RepID=A0ACB7ZGC7_9ERIC|nr:hypothetical protein Vadar_029892 [Vaccinium darrowii]
MPPWKKTSAGSPLPSPSQLSPTETLASSQPQKLPPQDSIALGDKASLAQSNNEVLFMPPRKKASTRRLSMPSLSQLSPTETLESSQPQELSPQNLDDLGDAASLAQSNNSGPPRSTNVRGKTVGKGVEKLIAHNYGQKLVVQVLPEWNSLCGINASKATSLLGVYLRMMCPIKNTPTWRHVDPATQSAVIQAVLDKCKISDDYHGNPIAQQAIHSKCYHMHINWRHRMKCHYDDILKQQLDPYNHPYDEMSLENWRHMIDDVWKSEKFEKRSNAGKISRGFLDDGHRLGSRSFVAEMTIPVQNGGSKDKDFPEVYEKTHTNKDKKWISPICSGKHTETLQVRAECTQSGVQMTAEEMSTQVLGKRKKYILGFGVGPKPSSCSPTPNAVSRARDEELVNLKVDMEKMWMEREEEKREREAEMEKTRIEHEQEKRAREAEMEQIRKEREEEKRAREAEMEQIRMEREEAKREREMERKKQTHGSSIHHGGLNSLTSGRSNRW